MGDIFGAFANVVTGIAGMSESAPDRKRAEQAFAAALEEIQSIGAPPDIAREILLDKFQSVGVLTPELEEQINVGVSKLSQVQEDPSLRDAQLSALELLKGRAETGLNASDRVRLNDVRTKIARENQARQADVIRSFQERGQSGSGAELAARLSGAQSSANLASEEGDRLAAMANENALMALSKGADLGGSIRNQDFNVASTKATAEDEFNRFNTQNAIVRQQRNIDRNNLAAERNLSRKEFVADANVRAINDERRRQRDAEAKYFDMMLNTKQLKANSLYGAQKEYQKRAQDTANQWTQFGQGAAAGAGAIDQYARDQEAKEFQREQFEFEKQKYNDRMNQPYVNYDRYRYQG